ARARRPRRATLFPYTPLFRSRVEAVEPDVGDGVAPLDPQQRLGRGVAAGQAVGPVGADEEHGTGPGRGSTAGSAASRSNTATLSDRKSTRLNSSHVKSSYAVF